MKTPSFAINSSAIRRHLHVLAHADNGRFSADRRTRNYYLQDQPLLWANRHGIDGRADSLLSYLERVGETGISTSIYRPGQIREDLDCLRKLDFPAGEDINRVMARLEFNLTRAYVRYAYCQRFGYVNPSYTLNHCAVKDSDSTHVEYFHLFDIKVKHPDEAYFMMALDKVRHDSVGVFLSSIQPQGKVYRQLVSFLKNKGLAEDERKKLICNIERCRWQLNERPEQYRKHVLVNIPAYHLYACDGDSVLTMRVGCGSLDTRTPLLTSRIKRMDVNPQWIVPKSIAKGIVGRTGYLRRNNMFIIDKKRGKLPPEQGSYAKVMEGQQFVVQAGGPGNSLGRIIFRFDNNYSVYLHDTNSRRVFQRAQRAVSHGCVRVEKPFELAVFLLQDKDEKIIERIRYSMEADLNPNDDDPAVKREPIDRKKLIGTVNVEPEIPLFLTYFTSYPSLQGELLQYKDIYGYDAAILREMQDYIE